MLKGVIFIAAPGKPTKGKVPPSKNKVREDVLLPGEFWCVSCTRHSKKQQGIFVPSQSPIYKYNNGYLPICKACLTELYVKYYEQLKSEYIAVRRVCMKFDMYYNDSVLESVMASGTESLITRYYGRISLPQYKGKTYDDTLEDDERGDNTAQYPAMDEDDVTQLVADGVKKWGTGFTVDEYVFLNNQFLDWVTKCAVETKSREELVKELCIIKLQQNKALAANDVITYDKLTLTFQKTLLSAELTPRQETNLDKASEKPIGVMIDMFENERPISEPLEEWKDVDGIMKLILVYFIGHLCKMLGLKNKYAKLYEDEMELYRVTAPELQDADTEDIFEYLMENGFGESTNSTEMEADDNDGTE